MKIKVVKLNLHGKGASGKNSEGQFKAERKLSLWGIFTKKHKLTIHFWFALNGLVDDLPLFALLGQVRFAFLASFFKMSATIAMA